jgi:hypothetical protein
MNRGVSNKKRDCYPLETEIGYTDGSVYIYIYNTCIYTHVCIHITHIISKVVILLKSVDRIGVVFSPISF